MKCMKQVFVLPIIYFIVISWPKGSYAGDIEFNTSLLDVKDKASIESGAFKNAGFIVPGNYTMKLVVNNVLIGERKVRFYELSKSSSQLCLTAELVNDLGLKRSELERLLAIPPHFISNEQACYDPAALDGMVIKGEISKDTLTISIPQAYRDYVSDFWDPPSRWDEGENGALLDYGFNLQDNRSTQSKNTSASIYGVVGLNVGVWRLRSDWQARYQHHEALSEKEHAQSEWDVSRVYAYRALPELGSKLLVGEQDLANSMFDGFKFSGASVVTDDNMLPPNLRGYSPEVVGIAKSNAKVVISQQGRVIYETQVASGPFRIQDISSAVSGTLDVLVEEQDGSVQKFQVNTAHIPYLSRPGAVRYKFNIGKVSSQLHELDGPVFASSEFSWGVSNGWSLLGGALLSDNYDALSIGIGRDLMQFGAISFDMTESRASLESGIKTGASYRINYSKNFEEHDSQVAFAGYRFSEQDFMNMNDFIVTQQLGDSYHGGAKEMYSVVLSKQFKAANMGAYINYTHQSYWSQVDNNRVSLSLSHYFDVMDWRGLTASLTAYHNERISSTDDGMYFSLSVPFGLNKHVSYNTSSIGGEVKNSVSFSEQFDERSSYSVTASESSAGESASGFYTHTGDKSTLMANASYQTDGSRAVGMSLHGGITMTGDGFALHRVGMMGGSRIMVDTDGIGGIPVHANGPVTFTDANGKAVVADVSSYYRQRTSIDVDQLSDEAEPIGTPVSMSTLTEGAIGYRHFDILSGSKRMLNLAKSDGSAVPFAAEVFNSKGQQLGMVGDGGMVYLVGLHDGEVVEARWGDGLHCHFYLPSPLPVIDVTEQLKCQ